MKYIDRLDSLERFLVILAAIGLILTAISIFYPAYRSARDRNEYIEYCVNKDKAKSVQDCYYEWRKIPVK